MSSLKIHESFAKMGVNFPFFAAPMVGLSHLGLRELVQAYTPPNLSLLKFTEMLSTRRIPSENLKTAHELRVGEEEKNFIPQLLGNEELFIKTSIKKLDTLNPWGYDINMGCPVKHTLRHNWGVRLLGDIDYAKKVASMTRLATSKPLSVKMRGGEDIDFEYLKSFVKALESEGVDWITVHPRKKSDRHKGEASWETLPHLKEHLKIPLVANGDVQCVDDALYLFNDLKLDGVMFARVLTVRPWIFWQLAKSLGMPCEPPTSLRRESPPETLEEEAKEYFLAVEKLLEILLKYFHDEEYILERIRFFAATGSRWFMFGHQWWKECLRSKTISQLRETLEKYKVKDSFTMYKRIDL